MRFIGIIPARYQSTRFPGKPLAMLADKPIIQWVYEQVKLSFDDLYVATDDERIANAVSQFGGKYIMTSSQCKSGTDRCFEAYTKIGEEFDVVVNVQGDEPFIKHTQIETLKSCFDLQETQIATLVKPLAPEDGFEALKNTNTPKVVVDKRGFALYFSRSIVPFIRDKEESQWLSLHCFYKHLGIYAYRANILQEITTLPQSSLEIAESLEQLRWLENGYSIRTGVTDADTIGIDTPVDLERATQFIARNGINWYG